MKRNVRQQIKPTRRLILLTGIFSILGITVIWFLFYTFSGTEKTIAGKTDGISARAYVENENLTEFEVKEARVRPADDPVLKGTARFKEILEVENE